MRDDLIGKRYGNLEIIRQEEDYISPSGGKHKRFLCKCDCGNETIAFKEWLTSGRKKSCGCLRHQNGIIKHGEIHTRLYRIWGNMCNRCSNKNNPAWLNYGGRGITVCDEWKDYINFRDWAYTSGYQENLTIDRVDNDMNYEPSNCRWVDDIVQANNKRSNHLIEYDGKIKTIGEWARELGIPYKTLHNRIVELQWDLHKAFTKPLRQQSRD